MNASTLHETNDGRIELLAPAEPTRERILRVLGMTRRPLASRELDRALGLARDRIGGACDWLMRHGYVIRTARRGNLASKKDVTFWSLADKGRRWARDQGALLIAQM